MRTLSWRDVWLRRLDRHSLIKPAAADAIEDVVGAVCGIHAQVAASAELSLGLRTTGITREHIRDALWTRRTLVKTYGLRGTLHLLPTRELGLWLGAFRARTPPREPNRMELDALPPPHAQQRQVTRQGERIAEILKATAEICFADVKPRGHL